MEAGQTYDVSVAAQPVNQACSVTSGAGTVPSANVTNVTVLCVSIPPPPPTTYSIGGTVSGLGAGKALQLLLQYSGTSTSTISVSANGLFTFDPVKVDAGQAYVVSVILQPAEQTCSVTNGSGTAIATVTNIGVVCVSPTPTYSIGGTVSGLDAGKTLQLRLQYAGTLTTTISVSVNGQFTFDPVHVEAGQTYVASVVTQPTQQTCSVTNGSGTPRTSPISPSPAWTRLFRSAAP